MNLARIVTDSASLDGARTAIKLDDIEVSYALLDEACARVAGLLRARGIEAGDRVAMMVPNVPYFPICYYGILRAGGVVVPLNVLSKRREVAFHLSDSHAKLLFAWRDFLEESEAGAAEVGTPCQPLVPGEFEPLLAVAEPEAETADHSETETAVILYTSGTTGTPKGAELTHSNLLKNCTVAGDLFEIGSGAVTLGCLPLFHSFGQTCAMNSTVAVGGTLTLIPRFAPEKALQVIVRDGVNVFFGVPTMYGAMLHAPGHEQYDLSTLRLCGSGGAAMPVELMRAFEQQYGCVILEGYGLSETSPVASFNRPDRERKPGSIGIPLEGVEMKVVDENDDELPDGEVGEIVIRGHNVMKGYLGRPEATAEALRGGWFHSGDMARRDDDGYFFIVDRKTDMIIRGGFNVYPREVEEILYEHPAVREAAVLGVPDEEYGEEVAAAVVLKDGTDATAEELRDYVKSQVAAYKYPRKVWFVEDLPKGPTGKILKREIELPQGV
jgi:long-chain acyl-CoA synthetase